MAYNPDELSALTYANGFTLWHYRTPDAPSDVELPSYFDPAYQMLRVGDRMVINAGVGGVSHGYTADAAIVDNTSGKITIIIMATT